ncbi:MAG: sigma 54-interacting transcriptional regulator [Myxococcales bacterium]
MDTNKLLLFRDDVLIRELPLRAEAVEVGSALNCDLVVDDPRVPPRALLVHARGGTVWVFDLERAKLEPRVFAYDTPLPLGARHTLVRVLAGAQVGATTCRADPGERATLSIGQEEGGCRFTVLVGRGADARRVVVSERPLRIGSARSNDLVLVDPTVSAHHCRLEPDGRGLVLRDLASTNGTFVQGVRVTRAHVGAGSQLRVGRTDLRVVGATEDQPRQGLPRPIAVSPVMQEALAEAEHFAKLPWPVLVLGPSGAGKEELASLVHRQSGRVGPFVALNAGGLPRELIESELFGHERGAFTGAVGMRRGVFEQADGGTLLLDEIGELPLDLQARLLRVLETWQIRRVGSEQGIEVRVRLVCATHRNLAEMVQAGTFRQDLYYRLARLVLRLSPLRERQQDIVPLAEHFLHGTEGELGVRRLGAEAKARLLAYSWPGNARELRNVVCGAAALSAAPELGAQDIERAIERISGNLAATLELDAEAIEHAVQHYKGNLSAVSRALSIPRSTLRDRLKRGREP